MKNRYRILIVDDNISFRKAFRLKMADLFGKDIECMEEATNGKDAFEIIHRQKFDLIFMDINMPVMNGIEATRKIVNEFRDHFIVALSMYSDFHYLQEMLIAGAATYIEKDKLSDELLLYTISLYHRHLEMFFVSRIDTGSALPCNRPMEQTGNPENE